MKHTTVAFFLALALIIFGGSAQAKGKNKKQKHIDVEAGLREAQEKRACSKRKDLYALFDETLTQHCQACSDCKQCKANEPCEPTDHCLESDACKKCKKCPASFNGEGWYERLTEKIEPLMLDRDLSDHFVGALLHRFIEIVHLSSLPAHNSLGIIATVASEKTSEIIQWHAAQTATGIMRYSRPKKKDDKDETDYWPAMSAVGTLWGIYDENKKDRSLQSEIEQALRHVAVNEEYERLHQSALSFFDSKCRNLGDQVMCEAREAILAERAALGL